MRDFNFQTEATLFNLDTFAQPLRKKFLHIGQDVKIAYLTGLGGHLMRNPQLSKGANMLNAKTLRQQIRKTNYCKGGI